MGALSDYARPRDKVTALLTKGVIIRVKKGLYIFDSEYRKRPYSREILDVDQARQEVTAFVTDPRDLEI